VGVSVPPHEVESRVPALVGREPSGSGRRGASACWRRPIHRGDPEAGLTEGLGRRWTSYPGRPDYFTHWGGTFKYAASVLGLPIVDHPDSRPPQAPVPDEAKTTIRSAYRAAGLIAS